MKRLLAFLLVLTLCIGIFAGCGNTQEPTQQETEPALEPVEDDGIMKILFICHSLGTDASYMFPDVCRNEGMENLVFGRLYHSGCRMAEHVEYAKANAAQYSYDEYDISKDQCWQRAYADGSFFDLEPGGATDTYIEDGTIAQTMQFGIQRHDWDLIMIQGASYECANVADSWYTSHGKRIGLRGFTQELMDYVLSQDIEPRSVPQFGWNMIWSKPADRNVWTDNNKLMMDTYFAGDENMLYTEMMRVFQEELEPNFDFAYIMPSGTVMQNLKTTSLQSAQLYRDYGHATDFGRLAAAYGWYCTLTGTDISECKLPAMNFRVVLDKMLRLQQMDWELTEEQKALLVEAVGNAIKTPYAVTPSVVSPAK